MSDLVVSKHFDMHGKVTTLIVDRMRQAQSEGKTYEACQLARSLIVECVAGRRNFDLVETEAREVLRENGQS